MEVKNEAPFISVLHDFMYDSEMAEYRKSTKDKMHRSQHGGKYGAAGKSSVKRTSSQSWLHEYSHTSFEINSPTAIKVSQRLRWATRLHAGEIEGGEAYQVI